MASHRTIEREVKLGATSDFELPDLRGIADGSIRQPELDLWATYYDTPDQRLWSRGITLRHRTGEVAAPGLWTLKIPTSGGASGSGASGSGAAMERGELSWPGAGDRIPEEAELLLRGLVRHSSLGRITELHTSRQRLILGDEQAPWAELADDVVMVHGGPHDGLRFRQIELEYLDPASKKGKAVIKALRRSGATAGDGPKLAKAIGTAPERRALGPDSSVADLVQAALADGLDRLLDHDWRLRASASSLGEEDIHQARVAARRLRSDLKTLRPLLDALWVRHTRAELRWLGTEMGRVRDADVLDHRLAALEPTGGLEAAGHRELRARLAGQRRASAEQVVGLLSSERYLALVDRLHAAAQRPPLVEGTTGGGKRAAKVVPALVGSQADRFARRAKKARKDPSDINLHRVRIAAKQLRYASEMVTPVVGKAAARTAARAEKVQTILGEQHDAVTAEAWLREAATEGTAAMGFRAGQLVDEFRAANRQERDRSGPAIKAALAKKISW